MRHQWFIHLYVSKEQEERKLLMKYIWVISVREISEITSEECRSVGEGVLELLSLMLSEMSALTSWRWFESEDTEESLYSRRS